MYKYCTARTSPLKLEAVNNPSILLVSDKDRWYEFITTHIPSIPPPPPPPPLSTTTIPSATVHANTNKVTSVFSSPAHTKTSSINQSITPPPPPPPPLMKSDTDSASPVLSYQSSRTSSTNKNSKVFSEQHVTPVDDSDRWNTFLNHLSTNPTASPSPLPSNPNSNLNEINNPLLKATTALTTSTTVDDVSPLSSIPLLPARVMRVSESKKSTVINLDRKLFGAVKTQESLNNNGDLSNIENTTLPLPGSFNDPTNTTSLPNRVVAISNQIPHINDNLNKNIPNNPIQNHADTVATKLDDVNETVFVESKGRDVVGLTSSNQIESLGSLKNPVDDDDTDSMSEVSVELGGKVPISPHRSKSKNNKNNNSTNKNDVEIENRNKVLLRLSAKSPSGGSLTTRSRSPSIRSTEQLPRFSTHSYDDLPRTPGVHNDTLHSNSRTGIAAIGQVSPNTPLHTPNYTPQSTARLIPKDEDDQDPASLLFYDLIATVRDIIDDDLAKEYKSKPSGHYGMSTTAWIEMTAQIRAEEEIKKKEEYDELLREEERKRRAMELKYEHDLSVSANDMMNMKNDYDKRLVHEQDDRKTVESKLLEIARLREEEHKRLEKEAAERLKLEKEMERVAAEAEETRIRYQKEETERIATLQALELEKKRILEEKMLQEELARQVTMFA